MIRSLQNLELAGRRTLIRVDFDLPPSRTPDALDDRRLREALPTVRHALDAKARVILATHFGNPRSKWTSRRTIEPMAARLVELLGRDARLADDCLGDGVRKLVQDLGEGELLILENLAMNPGEAQNARDFAQHLAELCDVYVNEAVGQASQALASTVALPTLVPMRGAGLHFLKEINRIDPIRARLLPAYAALEV